MSHDIQIVRWDEVASVQELASAVMANQEPGYQIDGVQEYSELMTVFSSIRAAVPKRAARFNNAFSPKKLGFKQDVAHIDGVLGLLEGLAVHQNISDIAEVELGTTDANFETYPKSITGGINPDSVNNFRRGQTVPGRLTVFSEGFMDGLQPTAHYFGRQDARRPHRWTRYSNSRVGNNLPFHNRWIARRTMREVRQYTSL